MPPSDYELSPEQLRNVCPPETFTFKTTADLPFESNIIGQPRGVSAIEFGIDIETHGYNIYVLGPTGTGRTTAIQKFLEQRATQDEVPKDWAYVYNFETPRKPRALELDPGTGVMLRDHMRDLIEDLKREIPRALDTEEFQSAADEIGHAFQQQTEARMNELQTRATAAGFALARTPAGLAVVPVGEDGQPMAAEAYGQLPEETRKAIDEKRHEVEHALEDTMRELRQLEKQAAEQGRQLESDAVAGVLDLMMTEIRQRCAAHDKTMQWLDEVRADILDNLDDFKDGSDEEEGESSPTLPFARPRVPAGQRFRRYQVNLVVDHHASVGAPVVVLDLPTYQHLIGSLESEVRFGGAMATDFTMIRPGALHEANGGYLVVRAVDVLSQPFAWEGLKRALTSEKIRVEEPMSRSGAGILTPQAPEPEAIPLNVKVVLLGSPTIYYLLHSQEEDFPELFKVKADFSGTMERSPENLQDYAVFVAARCHEGDMPHFDPSGVARMVEYGSWLADDQHKLSTRFRVIADLIHEAVYWAQFEGKDVVSGDDVQRAIDGRSYRANLVEELMQERINEGKVFIDTGGEVVGQVNGLTVLNLGDYAFGQPSRVTARTYLGNEGVINIEREVEMAGPIHNKGLMILRGYLGGLYAGDHPLSLSASLTFEQNYAGVEGDSASSTELYALLSALSGTPIRQDIAVTGSVNQLGQVQPIGGATFKIEGFHAVCKARGLTGTQGVMIPASNIDNLMLRQEVLDDVAAGQFHIYAVASIDQGIELLTGVPAGERQPDGTFPEGTLHHAVQLRLREMAEELEQYAGYRQRNGR